METSIRRCSAASGRYCSQHSVKPGPLLSGSLQQGQQEGLTLVTEPHHLLGKRKAVSFLQRRTLSQHLPCLTARPQQPVESKDTA